MVYVSLIYNLTWFLFLFYFQTIIKALKDETTFANIESLFNSKVEKNLFNLRNQLNGDVQNMNDDAKLDHLSVDSTVNDEDIDGINENGLDSNDGELTNKFIETNNDDDGNDKINLDNSIEFGKVIPKSNQIDLYRKHMNEMSNKVCLLLATFEALSGRSKEAKILLDRVCADKSGASIKVWTNGLVKSACLSMSVDQDVASCLSKFVQAQTACPECPDVYLQRGQVYLLADQTNEALEDLNMAVKLSPDVSVARVGDDDDYYLFI